MARTRPLRRRRCQGVRGQSDVNDFWRLRILGLGWSSGAHITEAMAEARAAMTAGGADDEGHGTARGPPALLAGAGPMWGIGPRPNDHISCNDRDVP